MDMSPENVEQAAAAFATNQGLKTASEWRSIPGYTGYAAHPSGLIFSIRGHKPTFLKGMASGKGYLVASLRADSGEIRRLYFHRIIATLFLPVDTARPNVNHLDGNKHNNAASNLAWCTTAENLEHARVTGLNPLHGERNPMAKYSNAQVEQIKALRSQGYSYSAISKAVGCSIMQANRIARGLLRKDG